MNCCLCCNIERNVTSGAGVVENMVSRSLFIYGNLHVSFLREIFWKAIHVCKTRVSTENVLWCHTFFLQNPFLKCFSMEVLSFLASVWHWLREAGMTPNDISSSKLFVSKWGIFSTIFCEGKTDKVIWGSTLDVDFLIIALQGKCHLYKAHPAKLKRVHR